MQVKNTTKTAALCCGIFLSVLICTSAFAQNNQSAQSKDEQTIRALAAQDVNGKHVVKMTDDAIFVSGAYPRPIIGKTKISTLR